MRKSYVKQCSKNNVFNDLASNHLFFAQNRLIPLRRYRNTCWLIFLLVFGLSPVIHGQTVPVTFQVNMSYQIELGNFDPDNEFVDVAGSFNGWGSSVTRLSDTDSDAIYEVTVDGFTVSQTFEYKFRFNGQWDGREEFPGAGNNRSYTVQAGANLIYVWYNDEASPSGAPKAHFAANTQTLFENGVVYFEDRSSGAITARQWMFEGGSPDSSTAQDPVVFYPQAGSFDVGLIVSNETQSDTLVLSDYIRVSPRDRSQVFWWNNTVFYELFVRSFYDSDGDGVGDFRGIVQKLDYLNDANPDTDDDLGITGIWLMPIHESPSYHGYDVTDYRSVNSDYGSLDDFKEFLAEARNRGIRVIIDFVMNHSSSQHPWFHNSEQNEAAYRNFYRWSASNPGYSGPWGQQVWHPGSSGYYYGLFWGGMPDLNYEEAAVKDSIFAAADFWLNDVGVDGFRLDAVMYIIEEGSALVNTSSTYQFWGEFNQHLDQVKPQALAVGEAWTSTDVVLNYVNNNRLDFCFEFDLASAILGAVRSADSRNLSAHMQKVYNLYPHLQYGTFLTNHDQNRVMNEVQNDERKVKVAAAIYLTLPGIPYLYYGEEIGMVGTKPDEFIRRPMQWTDEPHAGFTSGTPWIAVDGNYTTYNVAAEQDDASSLLNWYKQLIAIRNQEPALRTGDYESVVSSELSVMAFLRHDNDSTILVIVNTSENQRDNFRLSLVGNTLQPGGVSLTNLLDTDESFSTEVTPAREIEQLTIGGFDAKIYAVSQGPSTGVDPGIGSVDEFRLQQNYPNPFNPATTIAYSILSPGFVTLKIYDLLGREIESLVSEFQQSGAYSVEFDAVGLASGVYYYRLKAGEHEQIAKKMLLIR